MKGRLIGLTWNSTGTIKKEKEGHRLKGTSFSWPIFVSNLSIKKTDESAYACCGEKENP